MMKFGSSSWNLLPPGVPVLWIVCAAASGCDAAAPEAERGPLREDSDGIELVRNLEPPRDTVVYIEPDLRIGMVEGPPEYLFHDVRDVAKLRSGAVVVVDRGGRVAVFDEEGQWVRDLGGEGRGPGEFIQPMQGFASGDSIVVWDVSLRRLTYYGAGGDVLADRTIAQANPARPVGRLGGRWVHEIESGQLRDPGPAVGAILRRDSTRERSDTLVGPYAIPEFGWNIGAGGRGQMVNPPVLATWPPWVSTDSMVVWSPGHEPRLELRDPGGRLWRVITWPASVGAPAEVDKERYFEAWESQFDPPREVADRYRAEAAFAELRPLITRLLVDDEGRIWAGSMDPANLLRGYVGAKWVVLEPDGSVERVVLFPDGFELMEVSGGTAAGVTHTDAGTHVVDLFRLGPAHAGLSRSR